MTMLLVGTTTVGVGGVASVTFASIPQTETDLLLISSDKTNFTTNAQSWYQITINGSGGSSKIIIGNGTSAVLSVTNAFIQVNAGSTATNVGWGNNSIYIPNYTSAAVKSLLIDSANTNTANDARYGFHMGLSSSTAAVTSLTITPVTGTLLVQDSTFSLYTITKGSSGGVVAS
jgi:hypothetical protein